jgi:N-acetyl-gamma-glutamyl-phosphate reductase
MKVGILNVTGYAGSELVRFLRFHPQVELVAVTGRSAVGQRLDQFFPFLDLPLPITEDLADGVELVFSALPHKASAEALLPYIRRGLPVVDISADFRMRDAAVFEEWYRVAHPAPELCREAVYGLTELRRREVGKAKLVANPGCHASAAILGLAPAISSGLITEDIVVDSKTGVSGGGRSLTLANHFSEVNENVAAYALDGHRHLPEVVQELQAIAAYTGRRTPLRITLVPHLVPMTRGILVTCYAPLRDPNTSADQVRAAYLEAYGRERFVKVVEAPPATKHTSGTNLCLVYPTIDRRGGKLVVVSCLDNLVKGASGQAIQNMNRMLGYPEETGLDAVALYP